MRLIISLILLNLTLLSNGMVDLAIEVCEMHSSNSASTIEKKDAYCCDEICSTDCCTTSYIYYFTPKFIEEEKYITSINSIALPFSKVKYELDKINFSFYLKKNNFQINDLDLEIENENIISDYTINNNGSVSDLYKEFDKLLEILKKS